MSTPVRGPDGPLGYAPPKARQQAGAAGRSGTAIGREATPVSPLQGLADDLKPPRIVTSPGEEMRETIFPPARDGLPSRDNPSRRDPLSRDTASLRDALSARTDNAPLRDARSPPPADTLSLRDALSPLDTTPLRGAVSPRDENPATMSSFESRLHDALYPRGANPLRDTPSTRDVAAPQRETLPPSRDTAPLRDALSPRDANPLRSTLPPRDMAAPQRETLPPSRDTLSPRDTNPLRDTLSPKDMPQRDTLSPPRDTTPPLREAMSASLREALSSRTAPRAPLSRDMSLRDALSSSREAAPAPLREATPARDLRGKRDGISRDMGPRSLLDDGMDLGLAPAREPIARWDIDLTPPPAPPAPDADSSRKRKKRSDVFEGDAALRELRSRLAASPEDQAPEPPIGSSGLPMAPAKAPVFASVVRLMGVMVLAAAGALGFLWVTSPHGLHTAKEETTLVTLRTIDTPTTRSISSAKPAPAAQNIAADPVPEEPAPTATNSSSTADKPWAVANYTTDATEKTMAPAGLSPRMAGPPRGPAVSRVAPAPSAQPAPAAVVTPPPSPPIVVPPPVITVTAPLPPAPVAAVATDRDEIASLLVRARTYLAAGDVAAARLVLRRAAERDDPQAALALGGTYDPTVLKRLGIISFHADPAQARQWYRKAADLGSADASLRLDQLVQTGH